MDEIPPPIERGDFDAILAHLFEGVIVVDNGGRVVWINPAAEAVFGLRDHRVKERRACEVFEQTELREIFSRVTPVEPGRGEICIADGQTFSFQITPLSEGGFAVILQDITPIPGIEQSKKEYTRFIAHELRSPLTAILGYAELIALAGPVAPRQAEFIREIQASVRKINTHLFSPDDIGLLRHARTEIDDTVGKSSGLYRPVPNPSPPPMEPEGVGL